MNTNTLSRTPLVIFLPGILAAGCIQHQTDSTAEKPNIVIIYTDDLGYGDVSCYGATAIHTPNIDRLAENGLRFTNAYAPSSTCTPSRYAMLTGEYAWRKEGTGIARGDAPAIIKQGRITLSSVLNDAGYATAVVGKWHLGLGPDEGADWNGIITPGPQNIGFDYHFIIPATGDRVPCVYVENGRIVGLDPDDPVLVSFDQPVGNEPTGKDHPELLKVLPSHGHDQTIINDISRIGYMSGGNAARWVDEDMADVITRKAISFMSENKDVPFFMYFSTHDIHVPRVPHQRFAGESGLGARGDVILQLDWSVGEIIRALDSLNLTSSTMVIFTSDNGPVVDDGYQDESVEKLDGHTPSGSLRGGKYSAFEAGTRIPFIVHWYGKVDPGISDALVSQVDLAASLARLVNQEIPPGAFPDSFDELAVITGTSDDGRDFIVEHALSGTLSLIVDGWKYIEPGNGARYNANTNIELGNDTLPQLYDLGRDPGEKHNLVNTYPDEAKKLQTFLQNIREESGKIK